MHEAITDRSTEQYLIVAGYSEGTLDRREGTPEPAGDGPEGAHRRTRNSASCRSPLRSRATAASTAGSPGFAIPIITDAMGVGQPTRYDTTYVAREYDTYADFPAYFNPLAIANSLLAIRYGHPDAFYDPLLSGTSPAYVTTVHNTARAARTPTSSTTPRTSHCWVRCASSQDCVLTPVDRTGVQRRRAAAAARHRHGLHRPGQRRSRRRRRRSRSSPRRRRSSRPSPGCPAR